MCAVTLLLIRFQKNPKAEVLDISVRIDESFFRDKRKHSHGRLRRCIDYNPRSDEYRDDISNDKNCAPIENNQWNYGNRIRGPWVFGLFRNHKRPFRCRQ